MASLDSLPADQRAVLQLVLQRGRTYDDIAALLSIDRAGVRDRALKAFDALGPQTRVPPERRALVTDYLLGQLPSRVADDVREHLSQSASERAWARVITSELATIATKPLPEIPVDSGRREPDVPAAAAAAPAAAAAVAREAPARKPEPSKPEPPKDRPSSRRGGAVLLALGALIVVIVVIVLLIDSGGKTHSSSSSSQAAVTTSTTASSSATSSSATSSSAASTSTSTSTSATATPIAQINLTSPSAGSKAAGIAIVVRQGTQVAIVIRAQNVPANSAHNAYAVWLYNSGSDNHLLGFVNPGVKTNGQLTTAGGLPANASHFKQLLVTLETVATPKTPGPIVLQGQLTGVP